MGKSDNDAEKSMVALCYWIFSKRAEVV